MDPRVWRMLALLGVFAVLLEVRRAFSAIQIQYKWLYYICYDHVCFYLFLYCFEPVTLMQHDFKVHLFWSNLAQHLISVIVQYNTHMLFNGFKQSHLPLIEDLTCCREEMSLKWYTHGDLIQFSFEIFIFFVYFILFKCIKTSACKPQWFHGKNTTHWPIFCCKTNEFDECARTKLLTHTHNGISRDVEKN